MVIYSFLKTIRLQKTEYVQVHGIQVHGDTVCSIQTQVIYEALGFYCVCMRSRRVL